MKRTILIICAALLGFLSGFRTGQHFPTCNSIKPVTYISPGGPWDGVADPNAYDVAPEK